MDRKKVSTSPGGKSTPSKGESPSLHKSGGLACPVPLHHEMKILLAHGGGGRMSQELIHNAIVPHFKNEYLDLLHDGAIFSSGNTRFAFTTDSYVVSPIFFPGGDIGKLAVNGTVNDLAMCGAKPMYLSAAFVIEEGFSIEDLKRIVSSMQDAAASAGVLLVTGDTKVVERGKADGIFINTSGIGIIEPYVDIKPQNARPGDEIIVSGKIGEHGIAIMSVREGLKFATRIESDTAPLNGLVAAILASCSKIHVLRDPTRGGLASAFNEIAEAANVGIELTESAIPVGEQVKGACEILGFDPMYVANEGVLVAFVPPEDTARVLDTMRSNSLGQMAAVIGKVVANHPGTVTMKTPIGGTRVVDMLSGEQLPRIC